MNKTNEVPLSQAMSNNPTYVFTVYTLCPNWNQAQFKSIYIQHNSTETYVILKTLVIIYLTW